LVGGFGLRALRYDWNRISTSVSSLAIGVEYGHIQEFLFVLQVGARVRWRSSGARPWVLLAGVDSGAEQHLWNSNRNYFNAQSIDLV
jgi:hypothetical protein